MRQPSNRKPQAPRRPGGKANIQKFTAAADAPLLQAVAAVLRDHSASKLKSMLRHRQFAVNGAATTKFDQPVKAGDELWVNFDGSFQVLTSNKLRIVYEDRDIMVIDKAYGVLSSSPNHASKDDTVFSILRNWVKKQDEKARIYVVHRLDRDTSGLMLLTRNAKARQKLVDGWQKLVVERKYEAIVEGVMEEDRSVVESYLSDAPNGYEVVSSQEPSEGAERAKTRYVTLERGERYSRVQLSMPIGHKNQLRVHMKDTGHPISGDRKYGGHSNGIHRLALHATVLAFKHPITGEEMRFESPAPASFDVQLHT